MVFDGDIDVCFPKFRLENLSAFAYESVYGGRFATGFHMRASCRVCQRDVLELNGNFMNVTELNNDVVEIKV